MRRIAVAKNTRYLRHGVAVSALFSAISLLFGTSADASFYPGHIDPGGTGLVPGFTGDAVFDIAATCVPTGFTGWLAAGSGGCGNATVYSADIDLYSVSPADPPFPGAVVGTFSLAEIDFWPIFGVYVLDGALAGVDTGLMGPEAGTGFWTGSDFFLQFVSGFAPGDGIALVDPAYIYLNGNISNPGTVTFGPPCDTPTDCLVAPAPEPGTLGLILGALGGGWLARRRKGK